MTTSSRPTVGAVLKMATSVAQKYVDAAPGDRGANADLSAAIAATWELVKGRLGSSESAALGGLITKLVVGSNRGRPETTSN
jgi:hypothetical protein